MVATRSLEQILRGFLRAGGMPREVQAFHEHLAEGAGKVDKEVPSLQVILAAFKSVLNQHPADEILSGARDAELQRALPSLPDDGVAAFRRMFAQACLKAWKAQTRPPRSRAIGPGDASHRPSQRPRPTR